MYRFMMLVSTLWVSACTTPPILIGQRPDPDITLQRVLDGGELAPQTQLRWGGLVVDSLADGSDLMLLVMEHAIDQDGRPSEARRTQGYFVARLASQATELGYPEGRHVTLVGQLDGEVIWPRDRSKRSRPRLQVAAYHLWDVGARTMQSDSEGDLLTGGGSGFVDYHADGLYLDWTPLHGHHRDWLEGGGARFR